MLKNRSVKFLLVNLLVGIVVLLLVIAAAVWNATGSITHAANQMGVGKDVVADILPPPLYVIEAQLTVLQMEKAKAEELPDLIAQLNTLKQSYDERNAYWQKTSLDSDIQKALFGAQKRAADAYWQLVLDSYVGAIKQGNSERQHQLIGEIDKLYAAHRSGVDDTVKIASVYADTSLSSLHAISVRVRWVMLALVVVGALLVAMSMVFVVREIMRRLGGEPLAMQHVAKQIAAGDLTVSLPVERGDESSLMASIQGMQANLRNTIASTRMASERLTLAAKTLVSDSQQVLDSSNHQSDATSSMAAAVEQVNVSIRHVAESADTAREMSTETDSQSNEGLGLVQGTILEINQIASTVLSSSDNIRTLDEESKQISSIINTIKGIAEQTNLLALNAAIEAARAGEQGRGFAVVADEVRKLAERTSISTQEITTMIGTMQTATRSAVDGMAKGSAQVQQGVQMAARAGDSIERIQHGSQSVLSAIGEISSALREQTTASEQIAQNVEKIAQMTESNGGAVGRIFDSAKQLEDMAGDLHASVDRFKV